MAVMSGAAHNHAHVDEHGHDHDHGAEAGHVHEAAPAKLQPAAPHLHEH